MKITIWAKFIYFCMCMLEIIAGCTIFTFVTCLVFLLFAG